MKKKGYFITFEGVEGSGKSTQIKRAVRFLKRQGFKVRVLREPGGTKVSEAIRKILLNKRNAEMVPETELLLYLAARAQIVKEKILPALETGYVVICDRFEDSTLAYQGFGRNLSIKSIEFVSQIVVRGGLKPDRTFLFDIAPAQSFRRMRGKKDRMEQESLLFHQRVRNGFLRLARNEPKRFQVLNAKRDKDALSRQIQRGLIDVIRETKSP